MGSSTAALVVASVKAPRRTMELISENINSPITDQRANAILKIQVLWKNRLHKQGLTLQLLNGLHSRYQVWTRLEENGQINMKVTPSQIEFTLPSPKIGIENLPVVDPPWMPKLKTKVENLDIRRRGQV